jgi:hypothetical protein
MGNLKRYLAWALSEVLSTVEEEEKKLPGISYIWIL